MEFTETNDYIDGIYAKWAYIKTESGSYEREGWYSADIWLKKKPAMKRILPKIPRIFILAGGITIIMTVFAGWPTSITPEMILLAVEFSLVIGVAFGYWQAYRASLLHPIDALRYE